MGSQSQDLAAMMANARPKQAPSPGRVAVSQGVGTKSMKQTSASVDIGAMMKLFGIGPEADAKKEKLMFDLWTRNRQQRASFDPEIRKQKDSFIESEGGQELMKEAHNRGSSYVGVDMVPYEEIPGKKQPSNLVSGAMGITTDEPTHRKLTPAETEALQMQKKLDPMVDEGAMAEAKRIALEASGFSKGSEEGRIQLAEKKDKIAKMKDPKMRRARSDMRVNSRSEDFVETPDEKGALAKVTTEALAQNTPEMRQKALEKALWSEGKLKTRLGKLEKERADRPKIVMKKQYHFRDIDPSIDEQRRAADATLPLIAKAGIIGASDGQIRAREIAGKVKHRRDMELKRTGRPLSISHAKRDDPIKDYRKTYDQQRSDYTKVRNKLDFNDNAKDIHSNLVGFMGNVVTYVTRTAQHGRPDIASDAVNTVGVDLDKELNREVESQGEDSTRFRDYSNAYTDILNKGKPSDFNYKHYVRWVKLRHRAAGAPVWSPTVVDALASSLNSKFGIPINSAKQIVDQVGL